MIDYCRIRCHKWKIDCWHAWWVLHFFKTSPNLDVTYLGYNSYRNAGGCPCMPHLQHRHHLPSLLFCPILSHLLRRRAVLLRKTDHTDFTASRELAREEKERERVMKDSELEEFVQFWEPLPPLKLHSCVACIRWSSSWPLVADF